MTAIITIDDLHKKYLLHHNDGKRYSSLREDLTNSIKNIADRIINPGQHQQVNDEEFWALSGINLKIEAGERVGIIGRNGAGKSTLLKVISRITEPTVGKIALRGRVSSLLEVGTGFHPELTGRENIYLNGAILGMGKAEITRKFDEIVDFAEVEKFLDTPVKHYSSGMYVRLAFSVAASLESEILIIDEVLAVGDARFQKKCLGKMEEASNTGRTILFVSHSMSTVTSLCNRAVLLDSGKVISDGQPSEVILDYYNNGLSSPAKVEYQTNHPKSEYVRLLSAMIKSSLDTKEASIEVSINEEVIVEMTFEILKDTDFDFIPNFNFYTADGVCAFYTHGNINNVHKLKKGTYTAKCYIPPNLLNATTYFVGLAISSYDPDVKVHFYNQNSLSFNVQDPIDGTVTRPNTSIAIPGAVRPHLEWELERV